MAEEGAPAPPAEQPAPDPTGPLRATLRGLTTVVAPTTLVSSLLFYFGWVRTSTQADDMGLHDTLLGFSTRDYVLNSLDPMLWPLVVGAVAALALLALHVWLLGWAGTGPPAHRRRRFRRLTYVGAIAGVVSLVLGTIGARSTAGADLTDWTRFVYLTSPLLVTAGVILTGYALHVRRRFVLARPRRPRPQAGEMARIRLVMSSLIVVLLLLSLFWSVDAYARIKGHDLAVQFVNSLDYLPAVTLYSGKRLQLQRPIEETDLGEDGSAYRYRYTGLRLLFRSGGRLFLRPSDAGSPVNIVIPESADLRLELVGAL